MGGPLNEEEVKIKYVLPALEEMGFSTPQDLEFEYRLGADPDRGRTRTFADVLVRRRGQVVLVIEVKAEGVDIRSADAVSQVVGYAMRLEPSLPLALLTNGVDAVLVDVDGGRLIEGREAPRGPEQAFVASLRTALRRHFLRLLGRADFSEIKVLADSQRERAIELLSGAPGARRIVDRQYLRSLYVERRQLRVAFQAFLGAEYPAFALVGEAGLGKTTFLCWLAESVVFIFL